MKSTPWYVDRIWDLRAQYNIRTEQGWNFAAIDPNTLAVTHSPFPNIIRQQWAGQHPGYIAIHAELCKARLMGIEVQGWPPFEEQP